VQLACCSEGRCFCLEHSVNVSKGVVELHLQTGTAIVSRVSELEKWLESLNSDQEQDFLHL